MAVTIKEIAAEAQVSFQAVSAVLNGKNNCRVSQETRERILRIAKELGYRKNFGYQLMQNKRTRTAAIVLSSIFKMGREEHIRNLVMILLDKLHAIGYSTYCNNVMTSDPVDNMEKIRELAARGAEHFIFIGTPFGHREIEAELNKRRLTHIGFQSEFSRNLNVDSTGASAEIFRFFQQKAGDDFRLLLPQEKGEDPFRNNTRFQGLRTLFPEKSPDELIRRFVLLLPQDLTLAENMMDMKFSIGYNLAAMAMQSPNPPKALFFFTDHYALGGVSYLHEKGFRVGQDVLAAGFNNIDAVRYHILPITSVEQPLPEIAEILLNVAFGDEPFQQTMKLKVHFR